MKSSIEKLPDMIKLLKNREASPNKIATEINADRRTVDKLLKATTEIGMVGCKSMEIEGREYRVCSLTPRFKEMLEREKDGS